VSFGDEPPPAPADGAEYAVEVYRSHWRPSCDERAFMLHAVGIGSQVLPQGREWTLIVGAQAAQAALAHLRRYEFENPPRRRRGGTPLVLHPRAWTGPLLYALFMVGVAWLAGAKAGGFDWLGSGILDTAAVRQQGEWWRAVTAVTLHLDVAHLLANLGFGAFFGWLAAQLLGPGVAFGTAFGAASIANLLNASFQPLQHLSAGASTMVFALLGLLAAYAWKRRDAEGERWAYRWAPLVAGIFLLGFTGAGGERTDVLAHLTGFLTGGVAGWLLGRRRRDIAPAAQWACGLGALALAAGGWWLALA
jgi:membrane associated rhomboid family serine protease